MHIETQRLIITEFTPDMAPDVCRNSLDEDTRRFVPDEVFETEEEATETLRFLISQYGIVGGPLAYPILTRDGGENIGYVQLVPLEDSVWEVGYHIAKAHTGRGYATEAVRAFLPAAARAVGTAEVYGVCLAENAASRQVLRKCGFEPLFEGVGDYQGQRRGIFRGVWRDPDAGQREAVAVIRLDESHLEAAARLMADFRATLNGYRGVEAAPDPAAAREEFLSFLRGGSPVFGAVADGELLGYTVCRIEAPTLWVEQLYVRGESRRRGVASRLFEKAEELAAAMGEDTVFNYVHPNNDGMIAFLRSKGYTVLNLIEIRKPYRNEKLTATIRVNDQPFDY